MRRVVNGSGSPIRGAGNVECGSSCERVIRSFFARYNVLATPGCGIIKSPAFLAAASPFPGLCSAVRNTFVTPTPQSNVSTTVISTATYIFQIINAYPCESREFPDSRATASGRMEIPRSSLVTSERFLVFQIQEEPGEEEASKYNIND